MSFIDATLLDQFALGFVSEKTFFTIKVPLYSGRTKRNAERSKPLHRFTAGYDRISRANHNLIKAAYIACLGPVHSFRFKDRSDYQIDDEIIGTAVGGADETMQIVKPYSFGTETVTRTITKLITGGTLTEDDVPLSHTVNLLTGIATFTSTAGKVIRATYDFDVPVYFNDDALSFSFENLVAHSTDVVLVEDWNV